MLTVVANDDAFYPAGLDALGISIIEQRLPPIKAFFQQCASADPGWLAWPSAQHPHQFRELFATLEKQVPEPQMVRSYFLPFAERLGMRQSVEAAVLRRCHRLGCFDYQGPRRQSLRPEADDIFPRVREILSAHTTKKARITALVQAGVCRESRIADDVASAFTPARLDRQIAAPARGIVLACVDFGTLGLLHGSTYLCYDELILLQRLIPSIAQITDAPDVMIGKLRSDLIALFHAFHRVGHKLWQLHLLHGPPESIERRRYQDGLTHEVLSALIEALVEQGSYTEPEAVQLRDTLIERGLSGLIDLRCAAPTSTTQRTLAATRVQRALDEHLGALTVTTRQEIDRRLDVLLKAIQDTGASLSVLRLLREYPSSPYRQRVRRRFALWKKRIKHRDIIRRPPRRRTGPAAKLDESSVEQSLGAQFALLNRANRRVARRRLLDFITYGAIGLLTPSERVRAIDSRLVEYFWLLKLGHLDGTTNLDKALLQVNTYAKLLQKAPLSAQLVRGIFNGLSKPTRYNGGEGEAVAQVVQRGSLSLKTKQLLRVWTVIIVSLPLPIINEGREQSMCYALVVLDDESDLPVGCWISADVPGAKELGLAVYDAIWHPAWPMWPVRGIPQLIRVPSMFDGQIADVERAATYLLSRVEFATSKQRYKGRLLKDLQASAVPYLLEQTSNYPRRCEDLWTLLHRWLRITYFPHHDVADVPEPVRSLNVALPASDSPAAGWLLPIEGQGTTVRNGFIARGRNYTNANFQILPGSTLNYREFPYLYAHKATGIFVERTQEGQASVEYVVPTSVGVDFSL